MEKVEDGIGIKMSKSIEKQLFGPIRELIQAAIDNIVAN